MNKQISTIKFPDRFLIGVAIGSGGMALAAERGSADFLLAINAGYLRNMGVPSIASMLPLFNSPLMTEKFACDELLAQCQIPVFLGISVWQDELDIARTAEKIRDYGFAGALNFPTCTHYSRAMQQLLSRAERGLEQEIAQLQAVQKAGLASIFFCANRTQARLAADAKLGMICLNMGWNVGGALGHSSPMQIEEVAIKTQEIGRLIKRINPPTKVFLEGGPISMPEDLSTVLSLASIDGYIGGSTIERTPIEASVADLIERFRHASTQVNEFDKKTNDILSWGNQFGFLGQSNAQRKFLQRLKSLTRTNKPILLLTEPGIAYQPTLRALSNKGKASPKPNILQVGFERDELASNTYGDLFGFRGAQPEQPPLLADESVDLLVILMPENLSHPMQKRLARSLLDGSFRAAGTRKSFAVTTRIVFISRLPIQQSAMQNSLMQAGLEENLASLLGGWSLQIPPLRKRIEDLIFLIEVLSKTNLRLAIGRNMFSAAALKQLHEHLWLGNEEELLSFLGALSNQLSQQPIQPENILNLLESGKKHIQPVQAMSEKDQIVDILWRHGYRRGKAAEALGISRKTLYNKIKKYGLSG